MTNNQDRQPQVFRVDKHTSKVTLTCPHCGYQRTISMEKLQTDKKLFGVKCRCGQRFPSCVEMRQDIRKDVVFLGEFTNEQTGETGIMRVENVSLSGVGFRTARDYKFKPGMLLKVAFKLDDKMQNEVKRQVEILNVRGNYTGARFTNIEGLNKDLGFYLMA